MNSRMDKYDNTSLNEMSRTKKNEQIYSSVDMRDISKIKTNNNVSIISDAPKEIDIEKIKSYISAIGDESEEKNTRVSLQLPPEEEKDVVRLEEKDYDINSVLEKAASRREIDYEEDRHRKINNVQIDILKNIKIKEEKTAIEAEDYTGPIEELNTQEQTIVDLIKNIQGNSKKKKDLFADLMADDESDAVGSALPDENQDNENIKEELLNMTQDLESIKEPDNEFTQEINLAKEKLKLADIEGAKDDINLEDTAVTGESPQIKEIDKSFFTNSVTFDKSDFDGFDDLEDDAKRSSFISKFAVFIIIIMLLATIFLILNFVLDWNFI